jgi:hypothetical protein
MINRYLALIIYFILSASYAYSFETEKSEIGWIGLYNEEMVEWLENQNRIEMLCPRALGSTFQQCRDEKLKSRTWTIDVREKPATTSVKIGTIAIASAPGTGLTAVFHSSTASIAFTPDLFDADWGYGPYFHQTFRDNRNDWFLLPRNPLPKPGWINISQLTKTPDKKNISKTEVYNLTGNGVVLTSIQNEKIKLRAEQPADMWCGEGKPPKLKPAQVQEIPFSDLVTRDGHLKLKIKYMRGC